MNRDEELTKIVKDNTKLIWTIVNNIIRRYYGSNRDPVVSPDDLFQSAMFGVMSAYDTFDESKGVKFATYLGMHVSYAVWREIFEKSKFSQTMMTKLREFKNDVALLESIFGRPVTSEEIAEFLVTSVKNVDKHRELYNIAVDCGFSINDEENPVVIRSKSLSVDQEVAAQEISERVKAVVAELPERHQIILKSIYEEDETLASIGKKLGVSKQRVHKIRDQIQSSLAKKLKSCSES